MFRIPLFPLANSLSPAFTCIASPALRMSLPRGLSSSSSSSSQTSLSSVAGPRRHKLQHLTFIKRTKKHERVRNYSDRCETPEEGCKAVNRRISRSALNFWRTDMGKWQLSMVGDMTSFPEAGKLGGFFSKKLSVGYIPSLPDRMAPFSAACSFHSGVTVSICRAAHSVLVPVSVM